MLRQVNPAARDDRDLVPEPFFHQLLVDYLQRCRDVLWLLGVVLSMIISVQVKSMYSFTCEFARNCSRLLSERQSSDNYRGWKSTREFIENIRPVSIILDNSCRSLNKVLNALLVNNRDEICWAEIERRS